jgi:PTH2 family peptidyl-tRNA hydrolase
MSYEVKQVIVMRKDLNMRKGKMIAQGAHASMKVILDMMEVSVHQGSPGQQLITYSLTGRESSPLIKWLEGSFAKICVSVDSEAELLDTYKKAQEANLPVALITDSGLTEFNGVPTNTCIAIGPGNREDIDKITGHLKLL